MADFKKVLDRVAQALVSSGLEEEKARDAAFHMADWTDDLKELGDAWEDLEKYDDERLIELLYKFLAHVPNHLAAAKKLVGLGPIEDVFGVGVLVEDEDD